MELRRHDNDGQFAPLNGGLTITRLLDDNDVTAGSSYLQRNVVAPFANSGLIEPYNAVASLINNVSGKKTLNEQHTLSHSQGKFLSDEWLWQTLSSGAGMVIPYMVASKITGGALRKVGADLGTKGTTAAILKSEMLAGITGAALYDGIRNPREGETRTGNVLGGVAAFTVFGAGNYWLGELSGGKRIAARAAVGFAGADAQLITSHLVSTGHLPSGEKLLQAGVSGSLMNNLLPPVHQLAERAYVETRLGVGLTVAADHYVSSKLGGQARSDMASMLYEQPWVRVKYGKHNEFSTDKNGTISLWGSRAGAEELTRGFQRLADSKPSSGAEVAWQESAALAQQGKLEEALALFRALRVEQEVRAHNRGQRKANQLFDKEVLSPDKLRQEIGAWPAPGGVSFEFRWRQEFNQFVQSGGKWRPGQQLKTTEPFPVDKEKPSVPISETEASMRKAALTIVEELQSQHHIAMVVGGAVRDRLLGRPARDYDITTSASPAEIRTLFKSKGYEVQDTVYSFVQIVKIDGVTYEIASFGGRRIGALLSPSLYEDSALRDVTINAMAMDPTTGKVYDFFGGKRDLEAKLLRTLREPDATFATDIRTLLRVPRMLSTKFNDFTVSDSVHRAMARHAAGVERLPSEWVLRELNLIAGGKNPELGLSLLETSGIANHIRPLVSTVFPKAPAGTK